MSNTYNPFHEQKLGSDLSGSGTGRTYVLANDNAILANMQIMVAESLLQPVVNFTFDTATNTITFVGMVWDDQVVTFDYWTESTSTISGDTYCTTLQIARFGGMGTEVMLEDLGTGDGAEDSYDTTNGNILADSYVLRYGSDGSNSLNNLSEGTDYTIYKDDGRILLTSAGVTKVDGKKIYLSYTFCTDLSDTVLASYIIPSSREVEKLTQNYYGTEKTSIEYFDGYTSGYPQTDRPFGNQLDSKPEFELEVQSVQSITSVEFLDNTGAVSDTVDSDYITLDEDGRVILQTSTVPNGKRNVKITYTHGYTEVPAQVQELAALIGAVMSLVSLSAGSYDTVTSYNLGSFSAGIGEAYVNIREVLSQINKRIDKILTNLGGNYTCA